MKLSKIYIGIEDVFQKKIDVSEEEKPSRR